MADLLRLIKEQNFENFAALKKFFKAEPYSFTVAEDPKLYMLSFSDKSDLSTKVTRQANGIILEKETNKLVHYLFEKCYEGLVNGNEYSQDTDKLPLDWIKPDEATFELFFEGSVIKLFYYGDSWRTATSRCLDASKTFWSSTHSFEQLFIEAVELSFNCTYKEFLDAQPKEKFCYSYLIQHPYNRMVINVD